MTTPHNRPKLTVVGITHSPEKGRLREVDWSILMARAQDGNSRAYARLLTEITPYLRVLCAKRNRQVSDIEDAVQDILLTIHAIRATYDPSRPFGPWLVAIANRRLVDKIRKLSRQRSVETMLLPEHESLDNCVAAQDEWADQGKLIKAIESLPEGQKRAVQMLKLNEISLQDAARLSGLSITALKVSTHRAISRLREIFSVGNEK